LNPDATFNTRAQFDFDDWRNDQTGVDKYGTVTTMIKAKPGFRGKAVGYDIDWLTPWDSLDPDLIYSNDDGIGQLGLKPEDDVKIETAVRQPNLGMRDRLQISASITFGTNTMNYGGLDFVYGDATTLGQYFDKTYTFPDAATGFLAREAYHNNDVALKDQGNVKAFALFSAYARTTRGGVYETGRRTESAGSINALRDGRLAGKPYLDHNPASVVVTVDLQNDVPGMHSYELNHVPLVGHADDIFDIDDANRGNALTGNTTGTGLKSGTYLELPTGPMLTIADFRRSNALTSPFLPNSVQPVANSRVSPLIGTDKVIENDVTSYALLDHSVLANHALYDTFYFSTIAPVGNNNVEKVLTDFLTDKAPLLSQAFEPYLSDGQTVTSATAEMVASGKPSANAYQLAAEYQLVKGPFNVNSTSIQAWKAVLSSLNKSPIPIFWPKSLMIGLQNPAGVPILPMSLVNGGSATKPAVNIQNIDNDKTNEWNGYRELSDAQMEGLAKEIVSQVKARGPFLSLSEFVNRRIGSNPELTRNGALQAAIDKAKINDDMYASQVTVAAADISNSVMYRYKTPENAEGNPAEGAPGWITQGDLMRVIEPLATVRADTFVIRTYGDATDANGKITARAYAEAVVQRVPEYLNPTDRPSVNVYEDVRATASNKAFGRRIKIVSFRWLANPEV
jgi:hypothetical protein